MGSCALRAVVMPFQLQGTGIRGATGALNVPKRRKTRRSAATRAPFSRVLGGQLSRAAEQTDVVRSSHIVIRLRSGPRHAVHGAQSRIRKRTASAPPGDDDDPFAGAGTTCSHQYKLGHRTRRLKVELALALSPSSSLAGNCAATNGTHSDTASGVDKIISGQARRTRGG